MVTKVSHLDDATISIYSNGQICGSGVLISGAGHALTATHLILGSGIKARRSDGTVAAVDLIRDLGDDLALIRIFGRPTPFLEISIPDIGTEVFVAGHPVDEESDVPLGSLGHYVGCHQVGERPRHRFKIQLNRGYSGSGVMEISSGHLVSVITEVKKPTENTRDFGLYALGALLDQNGIDNIIIQDFLNRLNCESLPSINQLGNLRHGYCKNEVLPFVSASLETNRIVFLNGAPGVGKTFLALQILLNTWEKETTCVAYISYSNAEMDITEANLNLSLFVRKIPQDTILVIDDPWPRNTVSTNDLAADLEQVLAAAHCKLLIVANNIRGGELFPSLAQKLGVQCISMTCESAYKLENLHGFAEQLLNNRFTFKHAVNLNEINNNQLVPFDISAAIDLATNPNEIYFKSSCRERLEEYICNLPGSQRIAWAVLALAADHSISCEQIRTAIRSVQNGMGFDDKVDDRDRLIIPFTTKRRARSHEKNYWWLDFQHEHYREALFSNYFKYFPGEIVKIISCLLESEEKKVARIAIVRSIQWPNYLSETLEKKLIEVAKNGLPTLRAAIGRGIIDNWGKLKCDLRNELDNLLNVKEHPVPEWLAWRLSCSQGNHDFWRFDDWLFEPPNAPTEKALWTAEGLLTHASSLRPPCQNWLIEFASNFPSKTLYATAYVLGRLGNEEHPHIVQAPKEFVDYVRLAAVHGTSISEAEAEIKTRSVNWPAERAYWTMKALRKVEKLIQVTK